jgi:hypothetical protein
MHCHCVQLRKINIRKEDPNSPFTCHDGDGGGSRELLPAAAAATVPAARRLRHALLAVVAVLVVVLGPMLQTLIFLVFFILKNSDFWRFGLILGKKWRLIPISDEKIGDLDQFLSKKLAISAIIRRTNWRFY